MFKKLSAFFEGLRNPNLEKKYFKTKTSQRVVVKNIRINRGYIGGTYIGLISDIINKDFINIFIIVNQPTIIDKPTKSIITKRKFFFFFSKRRIIPFSDVLRVSASSNTTTPGEGGKTNTYWETILELPAHKTVSIDGIPQQYPERLTIAESKNKEDMVYLADEIEKYLGRK